MKPNIKKIIELLKSGKIIAIPADTSYALCADATNQNAINKLIKIKKRPFQKIFSCFMPSKKYIYKHYKISKDQKKIIEKCLPGEITVIIEKNKPGIRMIKSKILQQILKKFPKPLTATSANPIGLKPARSPNQIKKYFKNNEVICFSKKILPYKPSSTIIDISKKPYKILRQGKLKVVF